MDRHIDQSTCDVSATLTLGYELHNMSDKDKETYCWPIFFGDANGRKGTKGTPIQLLPGQLCVYKGTKVEHWREPFRGVHQAQVFLHLLQALLLEVLEYFSLLSSLEGTLFYLCLYFLFVKNMSWLDALMYQGQDY